jgi:regulator of replication initiation timing
LQQQLATLQTKQKEVLQSLKEREERITILERELQDVRQQTVTAQDLAQGLQLENAQYAYRICRYCAGKIMQGYMKLHEKAHIFVHFCCQEYRCPHVVEGLCSGK